MVSPESFLGIIPHVVDAVKTTSFPVVLAVSVLKYPETIQAKPRVVSISSVRTISSLGQKVVGHVVVWKMMILLVGAKLRGTLKKGCLARGGRLTE